MKRLLIIRSVSLQQLDSNIIEIKKKFPEYHISLLAHEHGAKLAEKYDDIDDIVVYPFNCSFSWHNQARFDDLEEFDDLVVPVGNISGAGFFNVMFFSLFIPTKRRWLCNLVSDIKPLSTFAIVMLGIRNFVFSVVSIAITCAISIVAIPFLTTFFVLERTRSYFER